MPVLFKKRIDRKKAQQCLRMLPKKKQEMNGHYNEILDHEPAVSGFTLSVDVSL